MHRSVLDAEVHYYLKRQEMERRNVVDMEKNEAGWLSRLRASIVRRHGASPEASPPRRRMGKATHGYGQP